LQLSSTTAVLQYFVQCYHIEKQRDKIPNGWQQGISPEERGQQALQLFTKYWQLKGKIPEVDRFKTALELETQYFTCSPTKDRYISDINLHLGGIEAGQQHIQQQLQQRAGTSEVDQGDAQRQERRRYTGETGNFLPKSHTPIFPQLSKEEWESLFPTRDFVLPPMTVAGKRKSFLMIDTDVALGVQAYGSESDDFCSVCRGAGEFLCCESCPRVFHLLCCDPPRTQVPDGPFYCSECNAKFAAHTVPKSKDPFLNLLDRV
jgi:hypothetical protein